MSRYHRRLPLAELPLRVPSSPRLCRPLHPITALGLLRILLRRSQLHACQVKHAMPPHRIAAIRPRTSAQPRGMRLGSPDPYRQRNKRLLPITSRDHRHLLPGELQLAVLG